MISINNFEILNGGAQLAIDVETNEGSTISSILLWTMNNFKDYSLAVNLNSYLQNINNKEVIIVNAVDINLSKFEDLIFTEIRGTFVSEEPCSNCQDPALGIAYNLSPYYTCLFKYLMDLNSESCTTCDNSKTKNMVININLLIDNVSKAIEIGYYTQAINMIENLKKLCSFTLCTDCPTIECQSCNNFIQL